MNIIKKFKKIVLLILYLVVCVGYGVVYWIMANLSGGEMFLFQEDIILKSKVVSFERDLGININYNLVKEVFKNYSDDIYYLGLTSGNYPMLQYTLDKNGPRIIGMDWMRYYDAQWSQEGYNFYKCEYIEESSLYATKNVNVLKLTVCEIPEDTYNEISPNQYITLSDEYITMITDKKEYYITIDDTMLEKYNFNTFYELDGGLYFISNSYNCLDEAPLKVYNYEVNNEFRYRLIDFIYFSAVTITTLGYGDILPNSTEIRVLVMTETLVGMILIAIIASEFYDYFKNKRNVK